MSIPINVWYYNGLSYNWILKSTNDFQETKDEYKYFRVMSQGKKIFYHSMEDYFLHNKNKIDIINSIEDNLIEYTNVNGKVIFSNSL